MSVETQPQMSTNGSVGIFAAAAGELEVGAEHTSRGRTVTEADLVAFAAQTGDWHPQHTDAQWLSLIHI